MRAALFLSATYISDGLNKNRDGKAAPFYFLMFCVFLFMDIVELAKM